jgi:serine/threonine protein kinase
MGETEKKETVKEAKILEVLSHPNIVKFIEVFKTKNGKLCIVMDFADGKSLVMLIMEEIRSDSLCVSLTDYSLFRRRSVKQSERAEGAAIFRILSP